MQTPATFRLLLQSIFPPQFEFGADDKHNWEGRKDERIKLIVVEAGPDVADDWIVERAGASDIVVTADIPLAARCLKRGAQAIGPTGKPFTQEGIGMALAMRDLSAHLRETGEGKGHNAGFTKADRSRFLQALEEAVQLALRPKTAES